MPKLDKINYCLAANITTGKRNLPGFLWSLQGFFMEHTKFFYEG
jgi:hypothetical protein